MIASRRSARRAAAPERSMPGLEVAGVGVTIEGRPVLDGVDLSVAPGSSLALLGPSGCGKTTLLRVIAGLERPDAGTVTLGDRRLVGDGTFVAPERRRIGLVFQDWALFPHLDVATNVAYGLGRQRPDREAIVARTLEMVGLGGFGARMPTTLSGGEQQRVAIARAIAPGPDALLLDEPFSNLDAALRTTVRSDTRALLAEVGMTTLFVTHDQEEAFVLGDQLAVMRNGRVLQQAAPATVYGRPADPWVATFVGEANLLPADADDDGAATVVGRVPLAEPAHGAQTVLVRPEHVEVLPDGPAVVTSVEYYGHDCSYRVVVADQEVRIRSIDVPRFRVGDRVALGYRGPRAVTFPPAP